MSNHNKRSHQIEQFRWEIASAKSQADLTLEIDGFLKEESERTLLTYSGDDSTRSCDFSAGSFTRRSAILLQPSACSSSSLSSTRNSNARNSSSSSSARSLASSSSRSITANPPLEIVFEKNDSVDRDPEPHTTKAKENSIALSELCRVADWFSVRAWLDAHSDDSLNEAIVAQNSQSRMTAFHILCAASKPPPPLYIVYRFATLAPEALRMVDFAGRLPLHHAIISGAADSKVVDVLTKAYPEAVMVQDKTGLLPFRQKSTRVGKSEAWFEKYA